MGATDLKAGVGIAITAGSQTYILRWSAPGRGHSVAEPVYEYIISPPETPSGGM